MDHTIQSRSIIKKMSISRLGTGTTQKWKLLAEFQTGILLKVIQISYIWRCCCGGGSNTKRI